MPAKRTWWVRVAEILATLEFCDPAVQDRVAFEQLFVVGPRRAVQTMSTFGGYEAGGAMVIERAHLMAVLRDLRGTDSFTEERRRRCRVAGQIDAAQRQRAAESVRTWRPARFPARFGEMPRHVLPRSTSRRSFLIQRRAGSYGLACRVGPISDNTLPIAPPP